MDEKEIQITCSDDRAIGHRKATFSVSIEIRKVSNWLDELLKTPRGAALCPIRLVLPCAKTAVVTKAFAWCKNELSNNNNTENGSIDGNDNWIDDLDDDFLVDMIETAGWMGVPKLYEITCRAMASRIQVKTKEELSYVINAKECNVNLQRAQSTDDVPFRISDDSLRRILSYISDNEWKFSVAKLPGLFECFESPNAWNADLPLKLLCQNTTDRIQRVKLCWYLLKIPSICLSLKYGPDFDGWDQIIYILNRQNPKFQSSVQSLIIDVDLSLKKSDHSTAVNFSGFLLSKCAQNIKEVNLNFDSSDLPTASRYLEPCADMNTEIVTSFLRLIQQCTSLEKFTFSFRGELYYKSLIDVFTNALGAKPLKQLNFSAFSASNWLNPELLLSAICNVIVPHCLTDLCFSFDGTKFDLPVFLSSVPSAVLSAVKFLKVPGVPYSVKFVSEMSKMPALRHFVTHGISVVFVDGFCEFLHHLVKNFLVDRQNELTVEFHIAELAKFREFCDSAEQEMLESNFWSTLRLDSDAKKIILTKDHVILIVRHC